MSSDIVAETIEILAEGPPEDSPKKRRSGPYAQKFRNVWLQDPYMADWLEEVEGDPSKGFCIYCQKVIHAKYHELKQHGKTKKHAKCVEQFPERRVNRPLKSAEDYTVTANDLETSRVLFPHNDPIIVNYQDSERATPVTHLLHSRISTNTLRLWQCIGTEIHPHNLMYPIFVVDDEDSIQAISSLPGVYQYGVNKLNDILEPLVADGLSSVFLYPVCTQMVKDASASSAQANNNPSILAIRKIKEMYPTLTIACDVCLCPFTNHGHCGILTSDGVIDNEATVKHLSDLALSYAHAGAHILVPSDMMDGRVAAIKSALQHSGLANQVSVLSCAAKFASSMCREFKEVNQSVITFTENLTEFGDRRCYQIPPGSSSMAFKAVERDLAEGSDMILVMPALPYLDIVRQIKKKNPCTVTFVYQVSGEYGMLQHAASADAFDLQSTVMELLISMRRAGADVIITYFTPMVLSYLKT